MIKNQGNQANQVNHGQDYLEAYKMEIGLLINFGAKSLEFKRVHNNKLIRDQTTGQVMK